MKLTPLLLFLMLVLPSCIAIQPSTPSRQDIYNAAMKAVAAHGESWSTEAAGSTPMQNPRDGTWFITVGKIDMDHTWIDTPTPAFFPGTVRELIFSRDGILISYRIFRYH